MPLIVCGWYTPNYASWAEKITTNLDALDLPHDFVRVEKEGKYWQTVTLMKAQQVANAMVRHPDKTIVFLDVDCEVLNAGAIRAMESLAGDVGIYLRTKYRRAGGVRFGARSGTMFFKPTPGARSFVAKWVQLSRNAPPYSVDQDSLAVALGNVPEAMVHFLDVRYCAVAGDKLPDPFVLHTSASATATTRSAGKLRQTWARVLWWANQRKLAIQH